MSDRSTEYVNVPRAVIESIMGTRDSILPGDSPSQWEGPLLGAIDSLRSYLTQTVEPPPLPAGEDYELTQESSHALADRLGISYRQLADWLDRGLVAPRHVGVGSGRTRVLSPTDMNRLRHLVSLTHEYENVFGKQGRP